MKFLATSVLLALVVSGCNGWSPPPSPPPPPPPPTPVEMEPYCVRATVARPMPSSDGPALEELCPMVADRLCTQWQHCGCAPSVSPIACVEHLIGACTPFLNGPDIAGALARGTLEWSGTAASAFVDDLDAATASCDPVSVDLSRVMIGMVLPGQTCTDISGAFTECWDGYSCQSDTRDGSNRTCKIDPVTTTFQRRGALCAAFAACAGGLRCAPICANGYIGVCADRLPPGAPCVRDDECSSYYCALHGADYGVCAGGGATERGEPCAVHADCAPGNVCIDGSCAPPLADHAPCRADGACASQFCRPSGSPVERVCPETDNRCDGGPGCSAACDRLLGAGTCERGGEPGDRCTTPADCRGAACNGLACVDPRPFAGVAASCDATSFQIFGGLLLAPDSCVVPVCSAIIDPTGHGTYWLHPPLLVP